MQATCTSLYAALAVGSFFGFDYIATTTYGLYVYGYCHCCPTIHVPVSYCYSYGTHYTRTL
eukprot:scaffold550872_cov22-Prasinocladus_malaysianus.AAC.1